MSLGSVWYAAAGPLGSETQRGLKAETSKVASVYLHLPLKPQRRQTIPCSPWGAITTFQWRPKITAMITLSIWSHKIHYFENLFVCNDWLESNSFLSTCQKCCRNFTLGISGEVLLSSSRGYQRMSWMLTLEKLEWKEEWMMKKQEVKLVEEKYPVRSDNDRLQKCFWSNIAHLQLCYFSVSINMVCFSQADATHLYIRLCLRKTPKAMQHLSFLASQYFLARIYTNLTWRHNIKG